MSTLNEAIARVDSRDKNFLHVEIIQTHRATNNVNDRINRADFVEGNLLSRALMNFAFRFSYDRENRQ